MKTVFEINPAEAQLIHTALDLVRRNGEISQARQALTLIDRLGEAGARAAAAQREADIDAAIAARTETQAADAAN
jgi:hypothetical protein